VRRILILAFAFWIIGTGLAVSARADVRVTIAPIADPVAVATSATYNVAVTSDAPVDLADVVVMLPGHGAPCGQPDEWGQPYGGDSNTQFTVLSPGVLTNGRWVTFPGPYTVTPNAPLSLSLDVLTPSIAACFYAGATADLEQGFRGDTVTGTAQGGELDVNQAGLVTTGWFNTSAYPNVQLEWDIENQTNHPITVTQERLGLPAGFRYVSSRYLGGDPAIRSVKSFSSVWNWSETIPARTDSTKYVNLLAPCDAQRTVHARLRITTDTDLVVGTGNTGPPLQLETC
jgi:hypothetical protein